MMVVQVS
jgi:hypothetical protein